MYKNLFQWLEHGEWHIVSVSTNKDGSLKSMKIVEHDKKVKGLPIRKRRGEVIRFTLSP